ALNMAADLQVQEKDWAGAAKTLKAWQEAQPGSALPAYRLGLLAQAQRKYEPAVAAFEEALAKEPAAIEPLTGLVNALMAEGKPEKALQRINGVIDANPKAALAYVLRGRVQDRQGQRAEAEASLRKAVELAPNLVGSHAELANFFASHGDAKAAVAAVEAGLQALPGNPQLRLRLAEIYRRDRQPDAAIAQYEMVLKERPGEDAAANNLASLLLDGRSDPGSYERALQLASRFKTSQNLAYVDTLGWAYFKAGQVDAALPLLRKVLDQAPNVPEFQYHLAAVLLRKGDSQTGLPLLRKAVASEGDFAGKSEARQLLGKG
ncbi:MAG TPA: tetratricopeptide repeat protein, partial [Rhodocyclaceae bacterium]|nr:tetratricopeptide repeat protein [Rhodocyclaceae bacterium]